MPKKHPRVSIDIVIKDDKIKIRCNIDRAGWKWERFKGTNALITEFISKFENLMQTNAVSVDADDDSDLPPPY